MWKAIEPHIFVVWIFLRVLFMGCTWSRVSAESKSNTMIHNVLLSWTTVPYIMMTKFVSSLWASMVSYVLCIIQLHPLTTFAGAKLNYLSLYSLDFNPIKQTFHLIKVWLWQHEAETAQLEVHPWLIHQVVDSVLAESAVGWILNCRYLNRRNSHTTWSKSHKNMLAVSYMQPRASFNVQNPTNGCKGRNFLNKLSKLWKGDERMTCLPA